MHAIGQMTITETAITTATITKIESADRNRRCLIVDNGDNTADDLYVSYGSQPAGVANMHKLTAGGVLIWDNQAIPTGDVWVYHAKGSNMNVKIGVGK